MENQQITQKLNNINQLISKQLIPPQQQHLSPNSRVPEDRRNILIPVPHNQQPTLQIPQSRAPSVNLQQILHDQQRFKQQRLLTPQFRDIGALLNNLEHPKDLRIQQLSPQTQDSFRASPKRAQTFVTVPTQQSSYPFTPNNITIPEQQLRQLKEENIELLKYAQQAQQLSQSCAELKQGLNSTNNRLMELQKQLDFQLQANAKMKQDLIASEQEKVNQKRGFDEYVANLQLAHQRDKQQMQFQFSENKNQSEGSLQQQLFLQKAEADQTIQSLNQKVAALSNERKALTDNYNALLNQFKELQLNLDRRTAELYVLDNSFKEKQQQYEQVQKLYDASLEKYENNTKSLIQNNNVRIQQYEQIVTDLKQGNKVLTQQVQSLQQQLQEELEKVGTQSLMKQNELADQMSKHYLADKEQMQKHYEQQLNQLNKEKDNIYQQKQQQNLFLEQKIAVLIQENKNLAEQFSKIVDRLKGYELKIAENEDTIKNLSKTSHLQQVQYTKQVEDLTKQLQNKGLKKLENVEVNEKITQLEQQLQYKREELDLLLHHLDQVIEINREHENKLKHAQAQMEQMNAKNQKENDAYFQQIKIQKQQMADLQRKVEELQQQLEKKPMEVESKPYSQMASHAQSQVQVHGQAAAAEKEKSVAKPVENKAEIIKYQEQVRQQQKTMQELERKLRQAELGNNQLQEQIDLSKRESLTKSDIISQFSNRDNQKIKSLEERLQASVQEKQRLETKLLEAQNDVSKIKELEAKIEDLQQTIVQKDKEIAHLHESIKKFKKEKAQLNMQLMNAGMANLCASNQGSSVSEV